MITSSLWNTHLEFAYFSLSSSLMPTTISGIGIHQELQFKEALQGALFNSNFLNLSNEKDKFTLDKFRNNNILVENYFLKSDDIIIPNIPFPYSNYFKSVLEIGDGTAPHMCAAFLPSIKLNSWILKRTQIEQLKWPIDYELITEFLESMLDFYVNKSDININSITKVYCESLRLYYLTFKVSDWPGLMNIRTVGVDFDDTLTLSDTVSHLCKAALSSQGFNSSTADSKFDFLSNNYFSQYHAFMHANLTPFEIAPQTTAIKDQPLFLEAELNKFLSDYSSFEESMLQPLEDSLVLKGLTDEAILQLIEHIQLKPGAVEAVNFLLDELPHVSLRVISLNWSSHMIQRLLAARLRPNRNEQESDLFGGDRFTVHANELQGLTDNGISTGWIDKKVTGPLHKATVFHDLHSKSNTSSNSCCNSSVAAASSVFIGDSLGDLAALLAADLGIVIGHSSTLRRVCNAFGIAFRSLDAVIAPAASSPVMDKHSPVLYEADSWTHIAVVLFGSAFVERRLAVMSCQHDETHE
mmetsp:Transcript_19732/g.28166  ORF Transcript_19732/g.28166 Transcript_19732/m.28166 type:complete len:525 (+) Transcript_19732:1-1575(+)